MRKFSFSDRKNRGFGFITRKSDGADFFVHSRSIRKTDVEEINEGMEVEFLEVRNNRGAEAKDVRMLKKNQFAMNDKKEIGIIKRWNVSAVLVLSE